MRRQSPPLPHSLGVVKEDVVVLVVLVRRHRRAVGAAVRRAVDDEVPGATFVFHLLLQRGAHRTSFTVYVRCTYGAVYGVVYGVVLFVWYVRSDVRSRGFSIYVD